MDDLRDLAVPASPAARLTIWAVGAYAVWQGQGIMAGGVERWASPSFAVLRSVPNPTVTWGCLLIVVGLVVLVASALRWWWLKLAGMVGFATWSTLFAIGALRAAELFPTVASTGGRTYCLIAALAVILIWVDEARPATEEHRVAQT